MVFAVLFVRPCRAKCLFDTGGEDITYIYLERMMIQILPVPLVEVSHNCCYLCQMVSKSKEMLILHRLIGDMPLKNIAAAKLKM